MDKAEESISKYYNTVGWEKKGENTEDAARWEDLREHAWEYVSKCRLRVLKHIPQQGENILDMASGPIQYKEYLEYSKNFQKRYCVDLSLNALEQAKEKIGDHGVFMHGSFLDLALEENFFDCVVSLHTIYHIDKEKQETAIRKLLYVTKPNQPVIVVYSNPHTLHYRLRSLWPFSLLRKIKNNLKKTPQEEDLSLYFYAHPIAWWHRFNDVAHVKILPWRSFCAFMQKKLIPNNRIGKRMFDLLFFVEERFPNFFAKHFLYPMIILTKKEN